MPHEVDQGWSRKVPIPMNARVLIADDDENICQFLLFAMQEWGMAAESCTGFSSAQKYIQEHPIDLVLLDVKLNGGSGLDLISKIVEYRPEAKIIMITGFADKEIAISALRFGAFDLLEKPFAVEILSNTINRALEAQEKERSVKELIENLKHSERELLHNKERLEYLNSELMETNHALSVLARNIERERDQMEKRIAIKLKSLVIPAIEKLRRDKSLIRYEMELDLMVKQIEDLTMGFATDAVVASSLSFSELKIASLIKNGLRSEDIAQQLNISLNTVRTHRKNIRRKLKINNPQHSLKYYLHSKENPEENVLEPRHL